MPGLKEEFEDYLRFERERKPRTVSMTIRRLGYVERITGKPIWEVTSNDLRSLKRAVIEADGTGAPIMGREHLKGMIVATRGFHIWGALEGHWVKNGICDVAVPRVPRGTPDPLTLDEIEALKEACRRPLEYRLIYGGYYLGTRIGESAILEGPMWGAGFMRFLGEKNEIVREVPIHPNLEAVKWEILAHPATYDSTLQRVKRRLAERTGIEFVAHQLRDTFSTFLYDGGVPDRTVKHMLGHSQDVTGSYIEITRRAMSEAIVVLP